MTLPAIFTHTCDTAHGWLIVTEADIEALGLSDSDFSPYSYRSGVWRALEEDCDAAVFLDRYKDRFGSLPEIVSDENGARVRSWRGFGRKGSKQELPPRIVLSAWGHGGQTT
jgi:hypothetical protein